MSKTRLIPTLVLLVVAAATSAAAAGGFARLICRGECVGHGNTIAGGACFNQTGFNYIVDVLKRNGFQCPSGPRDRIVGVKIVDTLTVVDSRCPRVDKVYCGATIVGEYRGYRIDVQTNLCFTVAETERLRRMAIDLERDGIHCVRARDSISGVLLEKTGSCYRPQAVYCNRPY